MNDVRLQWRGRGSYCVPAGGGEMFLPPDGGDALRRAWARFAAERGLTDAVEAAGRRIVEERAREHDLLLACRLKRKLVLETHYCITLDRVPEALRAEAAANPRQRAEWARLYGIDPDVAASPESLRSRPFMMLDTRFFEPEFVDRLLASFEDLDARIDGLLVHGDNFDALNLLEPRWAGRVDCLYTDPPYNTGGAGRPYADRLPRSTWLTLMENRLRIAHRLLKPGAACFVSIDENEQAALELLLSEIFEPGDFVATCVWEAGRKNDSKRISVSHEYLLCFVKDLATPAGRRIRWRVRKEGIDEIYARARWLVRRCGGDYRRASARLRTWLAGLPDNHPARRHRHYCWIDARGVYHVGNISWPGGGGPRYEVLHPVTGRPCKVPSRGWMYPTPQRMAEAVADGRVHFGADENRVPCAKVYLHENEEQAPGSVFYRDGRAAMKRLRDVLGGSCFSNPKDERVIAERIAPAVPPDATLLDCFSGSGSAGHAVIELNRRDAGRRRYILIEQGDSLDAVLKTRLQRVAFSRRWKNGRPVDGDGVSHAFKYVRLESFEAARTDPAGLYATGEDGKLSLDRDAFNRLLRRGFTAEAVAEGDGGGGANADLVETFNHLLGLRVRRNRRWAPWNLRTIEGETPDGQECLVIWRDLAGHATAEARLRAWAGQHRDLLARSRLVYVNGPPDGLDHPNVRSIEDEFERRMFRPPAASLPRP
ncbi:MAG: site-specific DNA-methyltransferase [Phycisphaerae bacterium]